jgi:hypothetical protein
MLAHGPEILTEAGTAARAMPTFTVDTLESIRAVCDAPDCLTLLGGDLPGMAIPHMWRVSGGCGRR